MTIRTAVPVIACCLSLSACTTAPAEVSPEVASSGAEMPAPSQSADMKSGADGDLRGVMRRFITFAATPTRAGAASVPLAAEVDLGLSDTLVKTLASTAASSPGAWALDIDGFRGSGRRRANALSLLAESKRLSVNVGEHAHCAAPPMPVPSALVGLGHVSAQPREATLQSCLDWFSVDLFVDQQGRVAGVTLDLWEP